MCHGQRSGWCRTTGAGGPHCTPSVDRRTSTVVAAAAQPAAPELTANIHQSSGARRTTLGDTISWLGARATSTGSDQCEPSLERDSSTMLSEVTCR